MRKIICLLSMLMALFSAEAQIAPNLSTALQNLLDEKVSNRGNKGVSAYLFENSGKGHLFYCDTNRRASAH